MEKKQQKPNKIMIIAGAAILVVALSALIITRCQRSEPEKQETVAESVQELFRYRGLVEQDDAVSRQTDDLFIEQNGRYMIRADLIDAVTSAHAISAPEGYAVTNGFTQVAMPNEKTYYTAGAMKVEDDADYIPPVQDGEHTYLDCDTLFRVFGYETEYAISVDGTMVRLMLKGKGNDTYDVITVREEGVQEEIEPEGSEKEPASGTDYVPEHETVDIVGTISDTESNLYSDAELDQKWAKTRSAVKDIFSSGTPASGNVAVKERSENMIAFNPMVHAIFVDTVCVSRPELDNDVFITAEFDGEWSDQASSATENNRAFYEGLPRIYEQTIKAVLGEKEGEKFYSWIKEHADKMTDGGYFVTIDETGTYHTEWRDEPCGDGVASYALDFSPWNHRTTDDGLYYEAAMYADGFILTVFK